MESLKSSQVGKKEKLMKIIWIRHGKTEGNIEKRYMGTTDQQLCGEGILEIKSIRYPFVDRVVVSPMKRCVETARIIYPTVPFVIERDFREIDFGLFEGKTYLELRNVEEYQRWINSNGTLPFPKGESLEAFKSRVISGFQRIFVNNTAFRREETVACVVHGGTIMAIMEAYGIPKKDYYDFQVKNGCGYITEFDGKYLHIEALL